MIIAEVGQNWCGDINLAKKLIRLAKENGADLVKFQLYDHRKLYADHPEIPNCELSKQQAFDLFNYGKEVGIEVFFSVFDVERVKWCEEMGVKIYKIAYSQRNNWQLINAILDDPIGSLIISSDNTCLWGDTKFLYCVPQYPAPITSINFSAGSGPIFDEDYDGFSDHTIGLDAAKIALARGAEIIEKHFAIDHSTGVDAPWSMTPDELKELKRWEGIVKQVL